MKNHGILLLLPIVGIVSSCAIFAPESRDQLNDELPPSFSLYDEGELDTTNRWWETFGSDELNALVEEALTNSPTIQQSWARLAQAEAFAERIGAARYPSVGYDGSTGVSKNSTLFQGSPAYTTSERYSLGLSATYELDLWGRIKSETEAAALDREASREQLYTAAITLASQVTLNWIGIISQRLQTNVIKEQLVANLSSLELIELRFRKSISSAIDVYQQRQTVAATESRLPLAELREELTMNALAALLGYTDFDQLTVNDTDLPELGPLPSIGIPADVLANRPDVRQAGLRLQSADWSVSAARADRLPAIRLTGSAAYANTEISDLFDNWFANLGASLTGPIFDGGRRKAEVERTQAVADERLAAYRETVINAIKEVEDALISEQKQYEYLLSFDERLVSARQSLEEAVNRYRNGIIEYTTVLIQLGSLQELERNRVEAQFDLIRYRIDLYRALGGTWPNELTSN